ncbi:unnamed protein product [Gadus morhua 'NCC']
MPSSTAHPRPRPGFKLETLPLPPYGLSCMLRISRNYQQHCETLFWSLTSWTTLTEQLRRLHPHPLQHSPSCQSAQRVRPALDGLRPCDGETQQRTLPSLKIKI